MILFSSDALSDVERIRTFLEIKNPQAAARALRAIWIALERAEASPKLGRLVKGTDIRQIIVRFGRHGYIVRYRAFAADGLIFVTRVWHGREGRE